jgi:hypothetical protein
MKLMEPVKALGDIVSLSQSKTATELLPQETKFAIVAQVFKMAKNQDIVSIFKADDSEYMAAYVAVVGSHLLVRSKDRVVYEEDLAKIEARYGLNAGIKERGVVVSADKDYGPMLGAYSKKGGCVLEGPNAKFYLKTITPIPGANFKSSTAGLNEGFNPLFDQLAAGGAAVVRPSRQTSLWLWLLGLGLMAAAMAWLVLAK